MNSFWCVGGLVQVGLRRGMVVAVRLLRTGLVLHKGGGVFLVQHVWVCDHIGTGLRP